jgi:hypothetical protein
MTSPTPDPLSAETAPRFGGLKLLVIVVVATCVATLFSVWAVSTYLFPTEFKPVSLSAKEENVLEQKLSRLDSFQSRPAGNGSARSLAPERYSEEGASREIVLTEKELNALLAHNTDLASKLAIDLSDEMASAKLLVPLDEDFPVLGGKTLKVSAGLELSYRDGRPAIAIAGVSLWGVPIPNAWMGNLKKVDLVKEYGGQGGFWTAFAAGVDEVRIADGQLLLRLKE